MFTHALTATQIVINNGANHMLAVLLHLADLMLPTSFTEPLHPYKQLGRCE